MITAVPLTAAAFAPFGDVLEAPSDARIYFEERLGNARPAAWPSLSIARAAAAPPGPLTANLMERHPFSSQSFVPMAPGRFFVMVAPHAAAGGPDMTKALAFVAGPGQGITYGVDVWHHPATALGEALSFGVFMWRDGSERDTEFAPLAQPVTVILP